jgi:ectoine hydroxylase-related dioxygenase (phytanoyl-CoA dioxygenase family)
MEVVTVWLAIDPSTKANGAMHVIPRKLHGYSDYEVCDEKANVFSSEIKRHQFDESQAVPIELEPNQCSLHDGRLMHGSPANTSNIRRCGYTMRYVSTRVKFSEETHGKFHHFYLARGKNHAGNKYGDPTKIYEHLARYRETHGKNGH